MTNASALTLLAADKCDTSLTWSSGLGIGLVFFFSLAGLALLAYVLGRP